MKRAGFPEIGGVPGPKLSLKQLRWWLADGRGEAIAYLRTAGRGAHDDLIFLACTKDERLDPYFEDPEEYLFEVLLTASHPAMLVQRLGKKVDRMRPGFARRMVFGILALASRRGVPEARDLILKAIEKRLDIDELRWSLNWACEAGFELALSHASRMSQWQRFLLREEAREVFGKRRAATLMRAYCRQFGLTRLLFEEPIPEIPPSPEPPDGDPVELILSGERRRINWGSLSQDVLERLARVVEEGDDPGRALAAARPFRSERVPFPGSAERLLKRFDSSEVLEHQSDWARVLGRQKHPLVREKALTLVCQGEFDLVRLGLDMLEASGTSADLREAVSAIKPFCADRNLFHSLYISASGIKCRKSTDLLMFFFMHLGCDYCRSRVAATLNRRGALSTHQLKMLSLDRNEDTRRMAQRKLRLNGLL